MDKFLDRMRPINIEDEIRSSYLDYSMSVIVGRALPDVRDGLKPVHRRVLYAMSELSNEWNKPHKKSARIVGDVIGKYHPHGDSAVYDALVRMAQPWSLRYPLADGQGNFGSIDGDMPAAMRYTEVRMSRMASEMLADIEKDTVDWQPNYDETLSEPTVLPSRVPNLLVNGSSGIAVGMSTNIPPHNLREVADAVIALIDQPRLTSLELMRFIPGPDFPTAGIIGADENLRKAYTTGRGIIPVRGRAHVEDSTEKSGRLSIVITEIPYQLNKTRLIEAIAELVRDKKIDGVTDIRDESSRKGMRVVLELRRDANPDIILRHLYKHTPLQTSFGIIFLAIVDGRPEVLDLRSLLRHFISHRKEVVTRRTRFDLQKAEDRAHILEGYKIALDEIDAVIEAIRTSTSPLEAKDRLMTRFVLTERQAQAVLELRLQRLTGMEREKILEELEEVRRQIQYLRGLLADEALLYGVIKDEMQEVRDQFGDERRTEIVPFESSVTDEDLIPVEEMVVTVSHSGYIKRDSLAEYRSQRRGGRGKMGMSTKDEDFVRDLFVASTHSYLLIFTTFGRAYWTKVYELPQVSRTAKGKPIVNLVDLQEGDKVAAIVPVVDFKEGSSLLVATRQGVVKRMDLMDFSRPRAAGIIAATIDEGDEIIAVRHATENQEVLISTAGGMAIRFALSEVREVGRGARGVRGIKLDEGDVVIGMETVNPDDVILTVTARGYGKRTPLAEYRLQSRAGQGVIDIKTGERNGPVVGMTKVRDQDHVMLITDEGKIIRTPAADIRQVGRNTWGVTIIRLDDEGERVTGLALVRDGALEDPEAEEGLPPLSDPGEALTDEDLGEIAPEDEPSEP